MIYNRTLSFLIGIIPGMFSVHQAHSSFEMKSPEGFHWYNETPLEEPLDPEPDLREVSPSSAGQISPPSYTDQMKKFKKDMKEAQNRAILNPTYENVQVLKAYQDRAMTQSTDFSKMWMVVNFMEGGLRPEDNADNQFRKIFEAEESNALDQKIQDVAQTHGLFFFFKQDCPYCHQFAPLLKRFSEKYGFEVKAISKEGGRLPQFPGAVLDNGMGAVLNPKGAYPSVFLANPQTGEVLLLAEGMVSLSQLKRNFRYVFEFMEGGRFS